MTDHKQAAGNDETASHAALFSDEYGADQSNARHPKHTQSSRGAAYSFSRLEQDFQLLQKKWQVVEREMSAREQQVVDLQDELDSVRKERDALVTVKQTLEDDLETAEGSASSERDQITELEAKNNELRVQVQEFEDYIDRRKVEWERLEDQVRDYEDAIKGMGSSIESHESVLAQKDDEKAGLQAKLAVLEQELAELSGRHGERESAHSELQKSLEDQSRELGSLNSEAASLKKEISKLEKKLGRRDKTVASLRKDLKALQRNELKVDAVLESEKAAISELQKQHEARINELELAVKNGEALEQQLRSDAAKTVDTIAELEIRTAELDAMYLESESERRSVEAELEAQRNLVETLENELNTKRGDLDMLDLSADRLSAIGESIRAMDVQIDSRRSVAEKLARNGEATFEHAEEILIAPEELTDDPAECAEHFIVTDDDRRDEQIRYPLIGESITIGRSRDNDIRIKSKYISRNHVRIVIDGPKAVIEDAGSTNGFSVNDRRVSRRRLKDGDTLLLGRRRFKYEHEAT